MTVIPLSDRTGSMIRHADFVSRLNPTVPNRHVDVWIPSASATSRYPVLYMHDGQNIFDPALAYTGIDWGIDEAVRRLMRETGHPGLIVVGIWNSLNRRAEYMPQQPLALPEASVLLGDFVRENGRPPFSDAYLKFLVEELKPFIDAIYPTLPDRDNTYIMGSSMGGLISLYALNEYPHIFRGAGCLSTHWVIGHNLLVDALGAGLPKPGQHKLYFDYGTATLDAYYEPYQLRMDGLMRAAGYQADKDWMTRKFEGAEHTERAWRERVYLPLSFLVQP